MLKVARKVARKVVQTQMRHHLWDPIVKAPRWRTLKVAHHVAQRFYYRLPASLARQVARFNIGTSL